MLALVDGNNFFVSCERIFDLSLRPPRPVAVLSNNDGCVVSRSNELKALGVKMGVPGFELRAHEKEWQVAIRSSNYELYGDISRRIVEVLQEFSPSVIPYSIDEAFLELALPPGVDFIDYAKRIRRAVLQWVGIPCGVGLAATKTLAKAANHIGKKRPDGVFMIDGESRRVLDSFPVDDVWGVGRRLAPRLQRQGITTAGALARQDPVVIRRKFGLPLARTVLELRGTHATADELPEAPPQSINVSRCFGRPVVKLEELHEAIAYFCSKACEKLRSKQRGASGVNVYFQRCAEGGNEWYTGGMVGGTINFSEPVWHTGPMLGALRELTARLFVAGDRYRRAGVLLFGIEPQDNNAPGLFEDQESAAAKRTMSAADCAVDEINRRYGRGMLFRLSEGLAKPWQMRRQNKTPAWTTCWDDLPTAR